MKLNSRVFSLLAASFLIASPLIGLGQTGEQTVSSGTEVAVPDGTYIHAKLRKDFNAKKAQVGDSVELKVVEDVRSQPATTVLIPKQAKLLGNVLSVEPAKEKNGGMAVSIRVVRAEWEGGFAKLSAVIADVGSAPSAVAAQVRGNANPQGSAPSRVGPPIVRPVEPNSGATREPREETAPDGMGRSSTSVPSIMYRQPSAPNMPSLSGQSFLPPWIEDPVRGKLGFSPPYRTSSDTTFYLEQRSFQEAAERGDAGGQFQLGLRYHRVQQYAQAAEWYGKAAEQGHSKAQNNLAVLYAQGQGVPQDYVAAYMWFAVAAAAKPDKNPANLQFIEGHMAPEQISEGKRRAEEWLKQHPPSH